MMKSRRFFWLVLVGMTIPVGACHRPYAPPAPLAAMQGSEPVDWRAVLGCWRMSETMVFALDSFSAVPRFVRPGEGARQARLIPWQRGVGDVFWRTTERNTLEFVIDDGLHGSISEFVVRDGRLEGRRVTLTDIVIPGVELPIVPVVAEREPCPDDRGASTSH
jgi:hypothetical protein